jgi:outer membrane protein
VKKIILAATLVASVLAMHVAAAPAQAAVPPVAIIDLTYVFSHHNRFTTLTNAMKADVESAETALKTERDSINKLAKTLDDYKKGTPEYKQLEQSLTRKQADLSLKVNMQKKDFLERESKIYYSVYEEILDMVKYYSEKNGIVLVIRFNGDPPDRNNPQEVLKELNKSVVYSNPAIDITPVIVEMLNQNGQPAGAKAPPAAIPPSAINQRPGVPSKR